MRAAKAEWTALKAAMDEHEAECVEWASIFVDTDDPDESAVAFAVELCNRCPLIDACRAYADAARPGMGIWGGRLYPIRTKRGAADEVA